MSEILEAWVCCRMSVLPVDVDSAANWLLEQGCEGVQIEDTAIQLSESEDAELLPLEIATVMGYRRGTVADTAQMRDAMPDYASAFFVEAISTKDWANEWRENFPPLAIGPFLVTPSWESPPDVGEAIILRLDPGLAFGTGQHPTTHMCLEILAEVLADAPEKRLLDVGCGSGILSVAAAKLGASVTASDLDPWCILATRENARQNDVDLQVQEAADLQWVSLPFPLVVANLMSDLLIRLAGELARVTSPGGTLMVSGISEQRAGDVESALGAAGFTTQLCRVRDGDQRGEGESLFTERWVAFVLQREEAS